MNSHVNHFDPVLEKMKEKEYRFKKCNPFALTPFMCTNCEEKQQSLNITNLKKKVHKSDYRV